MANIDWAIINIFKMILYKAEQNTLMEINGVQSVEIQILT